jgi:sugar-phosphatase
VIFDMDGLLVDSEPLWHIAEIEVFASVGVALTPRDCLRTTGLRVDDVVRFWRRERGWTGADDVDVVRAIIDRVVASIESRAEPKPGVTEAIAACAALGLQTALCSSSSQRIIDAVLTRLSLGFSVVCSAEHERFGKPDPAVYLSTARLLGLPPSDCLAVEDSPTGVRAAVAAGMRCVAVPDAPLFGDPAFKEAHAVIASLLELPALLSQ